MKKREIAKEGGREGGRIRRRERERSFVEVNKFRAQGSRGRAFDVWMQGT